MAQITKITGLASAVSALGFLKILFKNVSDISFEDEGLIKIENLGSEKWEPITRIRIGNYSSTNGFQGALSRESFFLKRKRDSQYSWRINLDDLIETGSKWTTPLKIKKTNVEVSLVILMKKLLIFLNINDRYEVGLPIVANKF